MGTTKVKMPSFLIDRVYIYPLCTSELVLKDRIEFFAICIIYKEHSREEVKSFHLCEKLETQAVIQFI